MADAYDFFLTLELRDDLAEDEITELRWHLGLGPRPERLSLIPDFPREMLDENGEPVRDERGEIAREDFPLLAQRDAAHRIGGAAVSALARRERPRPGWALTTRQSLHPDDFEDVGRLVDRLASHASPEYYGSRHHRADGTPGPAGCGQFVGYRRFYEDGQITELVLRDGRVVDAT
ncbi:hypothetical protein SAMN06297387_104195 [Streptomyces zhaozhouensis]|uniref:Uncharacterized protein n=1 Tax=Streptomyces zhaozhouensis TaxID=1300267 RepID=A0A286DTP9_9ACTN|nr:hypothetical protein [Streptomyces zhaozhouensis]SOD62025.1 hypothetical protein SAMN06297387_104195 [Streptomyces zhaozhouensis]